MKELKANAQIPIITKAADASTMLLPADYQLFMEDIAAADLYSRVAASKFHAPYIQDIRHTLELV